MKSNLKVILLVMLLSSIMALALDSLGYNESVNVFQIDVPTASGVNTSGWINVIVGIGNVINIAISFITTMFLMITFSYPIPTIANILLISPLAGMVIYIAVSHITLGD